MKLSKVLRLDVELPDDPVEAMIMTEARKARIAERVADVMSSMYDDWNACVDIIDAHERACVARLGQRYGGDA